ncbi:GntR family transcriptional regulator [Pseudorhodoferax sp. Leaf265]|jgi:DNA-binding GntR family transcriptional regulator|uniref:GntR family transcriptional regulator n=1 Tax=Pseudorhodoferax sp. Leaf265 TaxID=1736315 RepID=UPI0006FBBFF6|nr:GntR family transcriptional regulator [Pseudorhodoferax sp. Leaf265]KQP05089.1 hypothetical protein ASF45_11190 [Pseudorhodoferax sp. Leaf265]PZQ01960.1 MAG: GntR family transcriptional regulator [Variovorax paradoxus]PZQ15208.1 MAG: GntR family transcriptional regulator [Variovorax paradoxus]
MATPPSRRTLRLSSPHASGKAASKDDIYERIYEAVVEHRLLPGTKLSEERVAELFAVSRTQVRGVLQRLAVEQLVTLIPNRGAFVTTPSAEEAHDVLEVRRTLEPAVVRRLIERIAAGKASTALKQLRTLVKREQQAHANGDRRAAVRLSGEFHVLLAQLSGSAIMARMLRELTPLTCLAILTFDAPTGAACPNDEHTELLDAIEAGDAEAAVALMDEHLHHIEKSLNLDAEAAPEIDLAEALLG